MSSVCPQCQAVNEYAEGQVHACPECGHLDWRAGTGGHGERGHEGHEHHGHAHGAPEGTVQMHTDLEQAPWDDEEAWGDADDGWSPEETERGGTDGLAVTSMILGILGFLNPLNILAIILGFVALGRLRRDEHKRGRGMAAAGVILGALWLLAAALALIAYVSFDWDPPYFDPYNG
ncbi:MAG: DUF4190 domain-containing protein [Thermoplasmatota archaeon]